MRYSTKPLAEYKHAQPFKILHSDPDAWNLAYLSWDWEDGAFPDPHLSVNVWHTLMFVMETGVVDLANQAHNNDKVRGLMRNPPPRVVHLITNLPNLASTPMFKAYGQQWVDTMTQRSYLYREPHDEQLDAKLPDLSDALRVIAKLR